MTTEEQIKDCEARLLNAIRNIDVPSLDALLHNDLLFMIPSGETITKAMDMAHYRSGKVVIDDIASEDVKVHVIGDTAVVSVIIILKGAYAQYSISGKFRYIRVWKSFANGWQVIAGSSVQLLPPLAI